MKIGSPRLNKVKFTSGYVFILGGWTFFWKSSKNKCITSSTIISKLGSLDNDGE